MQVRILAVALVMTAAALLAPAGTSTHSDGFYASMASTALLDFPLAGLESRPFQVPDQVVIHFRESVPNDVHAFVAPYGTILAQSDVVPFVTVHTPEVDALVAAAKARPDVLDAYPDEYARGEFVVTDTFFSLQWGLDSIAAHDAWHLVGTGSEAVRVAVLDTGTTYTHPDLDGNVCLRHPLTGVGALDRNVLVPTTPPVDDNGHGTHVAGIVSAETLNAAGIAGVAQSCFITVKVLDSTNSGTATNVALGILHAAAVDADIFNLSLGFCTDLTILKAAVKAAWAQGALLVAAAGNTFTSSPSGDHHDCEPLGIKYPAAYPEVIAVGALTDGPAPGPFDPVPATYSLTGPEVEVSAPGTDVVSTWPSTIPCTTTPLPPAPGYCYLSGTSMATPHVSGVAALVKTANPFLTSYQIRCILQATVVDIVTPPALPGRGSATGFGEVDALAAVSGAGGFGDPGCVVFQLANIAAGTHP